MSSLSYEAQYQQTLADLTSLQHEDMHLTSVRLPEGAKNRYAFMLQYWLSLYVRYVQVAQKLILILNATMQPQQLQDMRTVVEACLGRLLEIKANLVTYCGESIPLDNMLLDMKLLPEGPQGNEYNSCNASPNASLLIPHYFIEDRSEELQTRRAYVLSLQAHYTETESNAPVAVALRMPFATKDPTKFSFTSNISKLTSIPEEITPTPIHADQNTNQSINIVNDNNNNNNNVIEIENTNAPPMSLEDAICLLQVCERGRQARQKAQLQLANYRQRRYNMEHGGEYNSVTGKDRAASVVQRVVLAYLARKHAQSREEAEKEFLGLTSTEEIRSNKEQEAAQLRLHERKAHQRMNLSELQQRTVTLEREIKELEGPKKMEEMMDEILMYMAYAQMESKDNTLIELPAPDEGGSLKLLGRLNGEKPTSLTNKRGNAEESMQRRNRQSTTRAPSRSIDTGNATVTTPTWAIPKENDWADGEVVPAKQTSNLNKMSSMNGGIMSRSNTANRNIRADSMTSSVDGNVAASATPRRISSTGSRAGTITARSSNSSGGGGGGGKGESARLPESSLWSSMQASSEKFNKVWRHRFVTSYMQSNDLTQSTDEELLRARLLEGPRGVMAQLRTCVDQLISVEVNNLKARIEAEKNTKRKAKRSKKAKKVKKPKLKDPSKGVELETLFNTTVYENKLQLPPAHIRLSSVIEPESVSEYVKHFEPWQTQVNDMDELKRKWQRVIRGWNDDVEAAMKMKDVELSKLFTEWCAFDAPQVNLPSFTHIRRALTEDVVLPLASQVIHDLAPSIKCVLLYGFHATGKTFASFAACNEAGANFFNLSPGNFTSTKGIAKTIQVTFNVARMKAPSIIYIDDVEKIFPARKSGKKGLKSKKDLLLVRGKKMKKELLKAITTTLQPTDRVTVLMVSSEPWNVDVSVMSTLAQRAIYFSLPDYSARLTLLQSFVAHKIGRFHELSSEPYTSYISEGTLEHVALLTNGYSIGQLEIMVTRTLPQRRLEQLFQRKLDALEFVSSLTCLSGPTEEEQTQMKTFYTSLPLHLRRVNAAVDFASYTGNDNNSRNSKSAAGKRRATGASGRKSTVTFVDSTSEQRTN